MDRSLGTTAQPRIQDVTPQILKINNIYGSSDYTNPAYGSSNRSLNYCEGGSITKPELDKVSIIPFALQYKDTVGLFGKENHFVKVTLNIIPTSMATSAIFTGVTVSCLAKKPGIRIFTNINPSRPVA